MGRTSGVIPQIKVDYVKIQGGLDLTSPALAIPSGRVSSCLNYEANDTGGLRRIDGYERFDGRTSPSAAVYYAATITGTVNIGDTITGATSGATGYVFASADNEIAFTKVTGTFDESDEDIEVGAVVVAAFVGLPVVSGGSTSYAHAVYQNAAADVYRADIAAPTGSGPVRGGGKLGSTVYVFRNNAGGTACNLWKSTASGWTQITLFHEISFTAGVGSIADGNTVTQLVSGATGLVKRVVLESGAWGADAAGRLIITSITGTFNAVNDLQVGAVTQATAASLATQITLLPGGKYETVNYNYGSDSPTKKIYGCDGVNRGFEFDGTTYVPITTGISPDTPSHVACHKGHLFFSFVGRVGHSGLNRPYEWTALIGADEIGIGDDITGFCKLPGEALGVVSEFSVNQLLGSSITDFKLNNISADSGGLEYSVKSFSGGALVFGQQGIVKIEPSQNYGNFSQSTVSRLVQPLVDIIKSVTVSSAVYGKRNQYRIYGSDGTGLCVTSGFEKAGLNWQNVFYITPFEYPIGIYNTFMGEDDTIYLCDTTGLVYQADKGSSFDGEEIERYFRLAFNHSKSPTTIKSYQKATLEVTSDNYTSLRIHPEFSYGDPNIAQHLLKTVEINGLGGYWDADNWGEFYYDSRVVSSPYIPLRGNGINMAIIVYSKDDIDLGHKIDGLITHYIPRRLQR